MSDSVILLNTQDFSFIKLIACSVCDLPSKLSYIIVVASLISRWNLKYRSENLYIPLETTYLDVAVSLISHRNLKEHFQNPCFPIESLFGWTCMCIEIFLKIMTIPLIVMKKIPHFYEALHDPTGMRVIHIGSRLKDRNVIHDATT